MSIILIERLRAVAQEYGTGSDTAELMTAAADALEKYGDHLPECQRRHPTMSTCDCGFEDVSDRHDFIHRAPPLW